MTTTTEPLYEGPIEPGMEFEYHDTLYKGQRYTVERVDGTTVRWTDGKHVSNMKWLRKNARPVSSRPVPAPSAGVRWERFLPTGELPGDWCAGGRAAYVSAAVGAVFLAKSKYADGQGPWSVREKTVAGTPSKLVRLVGHESYWDIDWVRLIRHADGRWADGYGPDGPIDAPAPAKAETCDVEWCGLPYKDPRVPCKATLTRGAMGNRQPAYCSPACADRAAGRTGAVQFGIDPGADEGTAVIAVEYGPDGEPRIVGQEIVWHNKPVDPRAARRAEWLRNWTSQSDAGLESSVAVESGIVGGSRIERANAHLNPRWRTAPYVSPRRDASVGCQLDSALDHEGKDVR